MSLVSLLLASPALTNTVQVSRAVSQGDLRACFNLRATVVFPNTPESSYIVVRDSVGGISMRNLSKNWSRNSPKAGSVIAASGKIATDAYDFPCVIITNWTAVSEGDRPQVRNGTASELRAGLLDYQLVRLHGTIREAFRDEIDPKWVYLSLNDNGTSIYVVFCDRSDRSADLEKLTGVTAAITGVCQVRSEGYRRITGRILMIAGLSSVKVLQHAHEDPFDAPPLPAMDNLDPAVISAMGRRRLSGHVVALCQGQRVLLRDNDGQLHMIRCKSDALPNYYQCIEAVGYPETDLYRINLFDARWRAQRPASVPDDVADDLSARSIFADESGTLKIKPTYHGRFIRLRGSIQDLPSGATGQNTIILKSDGFTIPVDVSANREVLDGLSVGCDVAIAGTCIVETENWRPYASFPHATGITLVVRKPEDVRVLRHPPWWTPKRLLIAATSLLLALIAVFIWNRWLNQLVNSRSRALLKEQLALAKAELKIEERTCLAIELHDSLSQTLAAVACQVSATKSAVGVGTSETLENLNTAERMLLSCRAELRRCLWDLRSDALDESNMTEVIQKVLAPVLGPAKLDVCFNVSRSRIDDPTAHAVICIIRELASNAIRHGQATHLSIIGELTGETLSFSVDDNGCGFDPLLCDGPDNGHFGLQGVRERVKRFRGTFSIQSAPGQGTQVKSSIRLPTDDAGDNT